VLAFVGEEATNGGDGTTFGDGLRCASGEVRRLGARLSDPSGTAVWASGLRALGGWLPGDTRRFQAWYRDPIAGPCGTGFNLTQGVQIQFVL
jgi:hypothetical protein